MKRFIFSLQKFVDTKIAGKKVVMFSKSYCPFCTKAKTALAKHNLTEEEYEVIEIENDPNCQEIQDYLLSVTGGRSVSIRQNVIVNYSDTLITTVECQPSTCQQSMLHSEQV